MFPTGKKVLNCKSYPFLIQMSTVSGQVLQCISTYSEKYISTRLEYISTAFSSTYPIVYIDFMYTSHCESFSFTLQIILSIWCNFFIT